MFSDNVLFGSNKKQLPRYHLRTYKKKKKRRYYIRELGFFFLQHTIQFPEHHMQEKVETLPQPLNNQM
jgi:hypothetical protein